MKNKGIYFALATALISGFAVFFNKFAGKLWSDSFVFTTIKNIPVAIAFTGLLIVPKIFKELKKIRAKEWCLLLLIGIFGGGAAFLLFFKGLSMTSAVSAAFIHKTLFIWVGFLAVLFLKEKFGRMQYLAFGLLFLGNWMLGGLKNWHFGVGELLVLAATLIWSVEYILAKKVLANVSPGVVGWARMFFGSLAMVAFLMATGRVDGLLSLSLMQAKWLLISSALLFGYVFVWYKALKLENASLVTCFLVPASLITTLLNSIFVTGKYSVEQALASLAFAGALLLIYRNRHKLLPERAERVEGLQYENE